MLAALLCNNKEWEVLLPLAHMLRSQPTSAQPWVDATNATLSFHELSGEPEPNLFAGSHGKCFACSHLPLPGPTLTLRQPHTAALLHSQPAFNVGQLCTRCHWAAEVTRAVPLHVAAPTRVRSSHHGSIENTHPWSLCLERTL